MTETDGGTVPEGAAPAEPVPAPPPSRGRIRAVVAVLVKGISGLDIVGMLRNPATISLRSFAALLFRPQRLPFAWAYIVVGLPFTLLIAWGSWTATFRTGAASAYMVGAVIAALGELVIDQAADRFSAITQAFACRSGVKSANPKRVQEFRILIGFAALLGVSCMGLNGYFAVQDRIESQSSVSSIQYAAFVFAFCMLPVIRFPFAKVVTYWFGVLRETYEAAKPDR